MSPHRITLGDKWEVLLRQDGIIHVRWFHGTTIEEQDALDAMAAADSISINRGTNLLVDMAGIAGITRAGRAVFASPRYPYKIALVGSSPVDHVIASFLLGLDVVPHPRRYFSTSEEAENWLHAIP